MKCRTILLITGLLLAFRLCAESLLSGTAISGNGWVGRDLGRPCVISILGWTPSEADGGGSTLLGVFEGANRADFMDALPLYIISETAIAGQVNYRRIDCSRGFRYVRYVAPSSNKNRLPALELWGDAGQGNDSRLPQLTNLPTVSIHTRDNQLPYDKEHEIECIVSIVGDNQLLTDTAGIRERGNASRGFPKKPYRIKFAHKHNVLGSPAKAKKWTLINNYGDKTLMRNQLAFELSRRFGMPYTPFCRYVDVLINGDYVGCYQLCDQIEVRPGRVDITEMSPRDNSGTALTGGYLIEADAYYYDEPCYFTSTKGTGVSIKSPDADSITDAQKEYIRNRYDLLEQNWHSSLHLPTFLRHFLVGELSGNTDTYWSLYLYKQRGHDTIYVGPVWDFDLAFENDNRTYPINNLSDWIYRTNGSTAGYLRRWVDKIVVNDADAKRQLAALWEQLRRGGLTEEALLRYVDEQAAMLDQSQRLNFMRWPIMSQYVHQNPRIWGSYQGEVDNVKRYLRERLKWIDRKLGFDASTLDASSPVTGNPSPLTNKVLRDGQIYILRDGRSYTLTGQQITFE